MERPTPPPNQIVRNGAPLSIFVLPFLITLAIILSLALSACTTERPHVAPPPIVREVVPVAVPCIAKADVPAMPPKVGAQLNGDAPHDLDIVAASLIRVRSVLDQYSALIGACTK